jgi:hypothetical protein
MREESKGERARACGSEPECFFGISAWPCITYACTTQEKEAGRFTLPISTSRPSSPTPPGSKPASGPRTDSRFLIVYKLSCSQFDDALQFPFTFACTRHVQRDASRHLMHQNET